MFDGGGGDEEVHRAFVDLSLLTAKVEADVGRSIANRSVQLQDVDGLKKLAETLFQRLAVAATRMPSTISM